MGSSRSGWTATANSASSRRGSTALARTAPCEDYRGDVPVEDVAPGVTPPSAKPARRSVGTPQETAWAEDQPRNRPALNGSEGVGVGGIRRGRALRLPLRLWKRPVPSPPRRWEPRPHRRHSRESANLPPVTRAKARPPTDIRPFRSAPPTRYDGAMTATSAGKAMGKATELSESAGDVSFCLNLSQNVSFASHNVPISPRVVSQPGAP